MIIRLIPKLVNLFPSTLLITLQTQLNSFSTNRQTSISIQLRQDLVQKLKAMNLRVQKSIIVEQLGISQQQQVQGKKKSKNIHRVLTKQQKTALGLMIPQPTFPLRMTRKSQLQYRHKICQQLYKLQQQNLQPAIRILQLQNSNINVDEYINSTYKDIFARYMVSRGYGVQWQANNSSYGVMNPSQKDKQTEQEEIRQFYRWLVSFLENYQLQKTQILGLYSYSMQKFVSIANVDVENIYKIGYFYTIQLKKFGRFQDNFQILQERGQKIQLLLMVQDPLKLLNIQGICVQANKKMIILSKFVPSNNQQTLQGQQKQINSYLITSMDIFTDHKQYFTQNGYTKHSIFESQHLLEMQAQNQIKIYQQIQGYQRKGGLYVIDRFSGLPDFQRSLYYQLKVKNSYIDSKGKILGLDSNQQIYITDPKYAQKVINIFQKQSNRPKQQNIYSTFQDQIYSFKDQKLHFKPAQKYVLPIPESHFKELQKAIDQSILQQSKIQIPRLKPSYPKPRDRRRHKKQIKYSRQQQTEYMSLKQCLRQTQQLSFSKIESFAHDLIFPLFISRAIQNGQIKQQIISNSKIQNILLECLNLKEVENNKQQGNMFNIKIQWNKDLLNKHLELLNSSQKQNKIQFAIKYLPLTDNLLSGFKCFKKYSSQPQLSNIVIQPQSKTQDIVPYFFHLHYFIHKMMKKKQNKQIFGRRQRAGRNVKNISNKLFSLIKFHPTIDQSQRNRKVQQILFGIAKANNQKQYGYGLQALRLWVAKKDSYLGDRTLSDKQVNNQLQLSAFIRKLYWQILPLLNINLQKTIFNNTIDQFEFEIHSQSNHIPRQKLSYLHNFIIDHINYYIINMQECYTKLNLTRAIKLTEDFFKNYINEIFVKNIRRRMINYPLSQQNKQHIYVLKKILSLLPVIAPLLPYSVHHITKVQSLQWPQINREDIKPQLIPNYNRMTKLRVEVRNKFILNNFSHSQLIIPFQTNLDQDKQGNQKIKSDLWKLSKQDMQLFFDIENISLTDPKQLGRSFKLKLSNNHPLGEIGAIKFYQYKEVCIRCSPNKHYGTHICQKCLDYLNRNFQKSLPLN